MARDSKVAGAAAADNESADSGQRPAPVDPEVAAKIAGLRSAVRENFGKAVMAMMMLPRYRSSTLADLQHIVLEPMLRDRIAFAYPGKAKEDALQDMAGFAIWASVSDEVDLRIREQIREGVFPVRIKSGDWNSGSINWLFDVIAPNPAVTASVIANFRKVAKSGDLRLHPLITRLLDKETLEKMGAKKSSSGDPKAAGNEAA